MNAAVSNPKTIKEVKWIFDHATLGDDSEQVKVNQRHLLKFLKDETEALFEQYIGYTAETLGAKYLLFLSSRYVKMRDSSAF